MKPFFESRDNNLCVEVSESKSIFPSHFHSGVEVLYSIEGPLEVYVNGVKNAVNTGGIIIIDGNDVHCVDVVGKYKVMIIPNTLLSDFVALKGKRTFGTNAIADPGEEIREIYRRIGETKLNILSEKGYVNLLLALIVEKTGLKAEKKGNLSTMRDVLNYINDHFTENITLEGLAKQFGYNKCYFSETFNKVLGMNLSTYLNAIRLESFSKRVLKGEPIVDAAYACGFGGINTFYRAFRARYKSSPAEYFKCINKDS